MALQHDSEEARQIRVEASKQAAQKRHGQELQGKTFDQDPEAAPGVIPERVWRDIPREQTNGA